MKRCVNLKLYTKLRLGYSIISRLKIESYYNLEQLKLYIITNYL